MGNSTGQIQPKEEGADSIMKIPPAWIIDQINKRRREREAELQEPLYAPPPLECRITERLRRGESIFVTAISAPWISPAALLLDGRTSLEEAMEGFETFLDSATHIEIKEAP